MRLFTILSVMLCLSSVAAMADSDFTKFVGTRNVVSGRCGNPNVPTQIKIGSNQVDLIYADGNDVHQWADEGSQDGRLDYNFSSEGHFSTQGDVLQYHYAQKDDAGVISYTMAVEPSGAQLLFYYDSQVDIILPLEEHDSDNQEEHTHVTCLLTLK
jgi:hypothetical protein